MDGYVLRRARAMLEEVGIVVFTAILQGTRFLMKLRPHDKKAHC
jgi:hypothetical protein